MKDRIKLVRKETGLNQTDFGKKIGVAQTTIAGYENGSRAVPDVAIRSICREFGVREEWLRTGELPMKAAGDRAAELKAAVARLFADDSAEFQQTLISALLQFDPHGPEWRIVEEIFSNVLEKYKRSQSEAPAPAPDDLPALEDRLRREYAEEKGETAESAAL